MQPILDIHAVQPGRLFFYTLGAAPRPDGDAAELFDRPEDCLRDAGIGLMHYFQDVQIRFAGFALGSHPVSRLVSEPMALFDELMARVAEIYQARAVPARRRTQAGRPRASSACSRMAPKVAVPIPPSAN